MCTTGLMLMIWKASSAQRREGGGESLRGAVSCHPPSELGGDRGWGRSAPDADMTGWSLLRLGRKVCKSRRSGRETESGKGPRPGLVGGSGPQAWRELSAAPCDTALHVARLAEKAVIQRVAAFVRGLHRQEDPAVLWGQGTRGMWLDPRPEHSSTEPARGGGSPRVC